jgi:hypothetical protein
VAKPWQTGRNDLGTSIGNGCGKLVKDEMRSWVEGPEKGPRKGVRNEWHLQPEKWPEKVGQKRCQGASA